jgi:formate dehydrogenase subunit gamma
MLGKCKAPLGAVLLAAMLAVPAVAAAQKTDERAQQEAQRQVTQPYNNAPLWREVRSGTVDSYTTTQVRGRETNVLINAEGEGWRQFRNGPVSLIGGAGIVVVALLIWAFYRWRGEIKLSEPPTGRMIQRFTEWERLNHWTVAISFVVLGISGLVTFFGKHVLLPVLGYTLFSWLAKIAITLHNFVGPVFFVSIIALFFTFVKKNGWRPYDFIWLKKGGGLVRGEHVSSGFFNAGEKLWFWGGLTFLGLIVSCSGFVLDFANFGQTRNIMQLANMVHGIGALLFVAGSFGHIYIGTIGMEGAYAAMRKGLVDESWAKEHHDLWYKDLKSGKVTAPRSQVSRSAASQHPV